MPDHFIVAQIAGKKPKVFLVSDEVDVYVKGEDPRESPRWKDVIVADVEIDWEVPPGRSNLSQRAEHVAIHAIATLDIASRGNHSYFRDALVEAFEMGMEAQQELDRKARESEKSYVFPEEFNG